MSKSNEAIWQRSLAELESYGINTRCRGGARLMDCLMTVVKEEIPEDEVTLPVLTEALDYEDAYHRVCGSMRDELNAAFDRNEELWRERGFGIKPTVPRFLARLGWKIIGEMAVEI